MSATEILIINEIKTLDAKYKKDLERVGKLYLNAGCDDQFKVKDKLEKRLSFIYNLTK